MTLFLLVISVGVLCLLGYVRQKHEEKEHLKEMEESNKRWEKIYQQQNPSGEGSAWHI